MTEAELRKRLDDLLALRFSGELRLMTRTLDSEELVQFQTGAELDKAIASLERRLNNNGGRARVAYASPSKGL